MSSSLSWHQFNAPHVDQLGWFDAFPGSLVQVWSPGVYDLYPLTADAEFASGPQALRIEKPDTGELYYLSYRQHEGYDDSLSSTYTRGVNLHRFGGGQSFFLGSLTDGAQFEDAPNDLLVTQLGLGSGDAYVTVQVDVGTVGDDDGDGILEDGDGSGTAGDNPCTGGETTGCDDNCPFRANASQEDPGGIGGAGPDGIGTVCQCGDVSGNGAITLSDVGQVRAWFNSGYTSPPTPGFVAERCDVTGDGACTLQDFAALLFAYNAGTNHSPLVVQGCAPAVP